MKSKALSLLWLLAAFIMSCQWVAIRLSHTALTYPLHSILPGLAVLGASFILTWGAELAELEISQGLAIAFLALIAVLPEYTVDLYFAWTAGKNPAYTAYATANMTGSNRLLLGLGWGLVAILFWARSGKKVIELIESQRVEILALVLATAYSFIIPLKGTLTIIDTVVFSAIFIFYITRTSKSASVETEIEGPAEVIEALPRPLRIAITFLMFIFSGLVIFISAGPFADGLLETGARLGIEKFILVQWLAPIASEAPEFIVAIILALKLRAATSLRVLVSSKVNQWTLLIGVLPLAFSISRGHIAPMILDSRQIEEILITSAQSLLGLVMLVNLRFSIKEAMFLLILFITQLFITSTGVRYVYSAVYLGSAVFMLVFIKSNRENFLKIFSQLSLRKNSSKL